MHYFLFLKSIAFISFFYCQVKSPFIRPFFAHFRFFGNRFRRCGNHKSLFLLRCCTFAIGKQ